jgi:hypothetical protein
MPRQVRMTGAGRAVGAGALAALLVVGGAGRAAAQNFGRPAEADLRIEWSVAPDRHGWPIVSGYVYNQRAGTYAAEVRLRVEALDAAGGGAASSTGLVFGDVAPSGRSFFEIRAPARGASYRVTLDAFSWRSYGAGGG